MQQTGAGFRYASLTERPAHVNQSWDPSLSTSSHHAFLIPSGFVSAGEVLLLSPACWLSELAYSVMFVMSTSRLLPGKHCLLQK